MNMNERSSSNHISHHILSCADNFPAQEMSPPRTFSLIALLCFCLCMASVVVSARRFIHDEIFDETQEAGIVTRMPEWDSSTETWLPAPIRLAISPLGGRSAETSDGSKMQNLWGAWKGGYVTLPEGGRVDDIGRIIANKNGDEYLPMSCKLHEETKNRPMFTDRGVEVNGPAVVLRHYWGHAYYHMWMEGATRFTQMHKFLREHPEVKLLVQRPHYQGTMDGMYQLLGISPDRLVSDDIVNVRGPLYVPQGMVCGSPSPASVIELRKLIWELHGAELTAHSDQFWAKHSKDGKDRHSVFITRKGADGRRMLGWEAKVDLIRRKYPSWVVDVVEDRGKMSTYETMKFFSTADIVFATEGAGSVHNIFRFPCTATAPFYLEIAPLYNGAGIPWGKAS